MEEVASSFRFTSPVKETSSMVHLDSIDSSNIVEDAAGGTVSQESDKKARQSASGRSIMRDRQSSSFRSRADNYGTYILEAQRFGVTNLDAQWEYARLCQIVGAHIGGYQTENFHLSGIAMRRLLFRPPLCPKWENQVQIYIRAQ